MSWARALLLLALLTPVGACGGEADQVELRLYPCAFAGLEPRAVVVEITGYDDQGAVVETFEVGFDDIDADVFADGYATVGYRKDARVARARFRVGWFASASAGTLAEAEAVAVYDDLAVPVAGEVLSLTSDVDDCAQLIADGTDTGETGTDTGETTTDGTDTTSSDGTTTDGTTTDGTTTTGTDTSDTTTDTGGEPVPMVGDDCALANSFVCAPAANGQGGTPLLCNDAMTLVDPAPGVFQSTCECGTDTPLDLCAGTGSSSYCLCLPPNPEPCAGDNLGCIGTDTVQLCVEGEVAVGFCPNCSETPGGYFQCR